jgi:FkbM family methyltransferase
MMPASGYLIESDFVVVKRAKHGLFAFNRNDNFIGRSLDLYGEWAEAEVSVLTRFLRPGATMVDVGANVGTHTVPFARAVGEQGTVLAFEPQRWSFHLLCANVALNALSNVQCLRQALGDRAGSVAIPRLSPHESRNFGAVATLPAGNGEDVACVTLDSLELPACDLIKIDVEGAEPQVLRGASATIARHRPVLFVENNTVEKARATLTAILDLGYHPWWHLSLYFNSANHFGNAENVFARYQPEANLLCFPTEVDHGIPELIACIGDHDDWRQAMQRGIQARNPLFFPEERQPQR